MPGFELIGEEELKEITHLFKESGILFRHSFDPLRNNIYKVKKFETDFSSKLKIQHALAVSSGTAALKVALEALGITEGDEVITQAFTFVATVEAIIECKAQPIITQIDTTLNMDVQDLKQKITPKTKAIIVVHMLGVPANMDEILDIANKYHIPVIEDTAWGCGGKLHNQYLGTIGTIGTYSFDFAKIITTGEGGMIVTNNTELYKKAAAYHDHGHENNPSVPRWEDTRSGSGFNFRMTEMQGAVGIAQLKKLTTIVEKQRENKAKIADKLSVLSEITLRKQPKGSFETADAFIFMVKDNKTALNCRQQLLQDGLATKILPEAISWHFAGTWNHIPALTNIYKNLDTSFTSSKDLLNRCVALPISINMPDDISTKLLNSLSKVLK